MEAIDSDLKSHTFDPIEVLRDYRIAFRSREVDRTELGHTAAHFAKSTDEINAQFSVPSAGQELAQIAAVRQLNPGDWIRGFYRNGPSSLWAGIMTARQMFAQLYGDTTEGKEPSSGGRMMVHHHGSRLLREGKRVNLMKQINHASDISSTGTQMPVLHGLARASRVYREVPELSDLTELSNNGNEVVLGFLGDSSAAEGCSYEAIAQAVVQRVPLVIVVMDNGYGISVPTAMQVPNASMSQALEGFASAGLKIIRANGWDYPGLIHAYQEAFAYAREQRMPALVHVIVTQPFGHSSEGDHERYKDKERLEWEEAFDCLKLMRRWILSNGYATEDELAALEEEEKAFVREEDVAAWKEVREPFTQLGKQALLLCEEFRSLCPLQLQVQIDPTIDKLRSKVVKEFNHYAPGRYEVVEVIAKLLHKARVFLLDRSNAVPPEWSSSVQKLVALLNDITKGAANDYSSNVYAEGEDSPVNVPKILPQYSEALGKDSPGHIISAGIATFMKADPRVVVYGEDTGRLGGVGQCTAGLQAGKPGVKEKIWNQSPALQRYLPEHGFGESRIWDHGVAESSIIGGAVGMALRGLFPIAELQFNDYVVWGLQQMVDEVSSLRHRTDGGQAAPMLIRTHGHRKIGMWHSGSPQGMILASCPGLRVLVPRNGVQAVSMYRAVLASGDPAYSVEPLITLHSLTEYGELVPDNLDKVCLPLGQSEILRKGSDVTIVTYGYCCKVALDAAITLAALGIEAEVIDLQTLNPLDVNGVAAASIRRNSRVVFLDEDIPEGASAIIAKTLLSERDCLEFIDGMTFVTAPHHKPSYGKDGDFFGKPQSSDVVAAALRLKSN